jgi:hypothetical protein
VKFYIDTHTAFDHSFLLECYPHARWEEDWAAEHMSEYYVNEQLKKHPWRTNNASQAQAS